MYINVLNCLCFIKSNYDICMKATYIQGVLTFYKSLFDKDD